MEPQVADRPFTVLVCRGCCCGRPSKHPEIDHDEQLRRVRAAVARTPHGRVRVVDCLDVCTRSNVVVVRDRRADVDPRARSLWLGGITTDALTEALCRWLEAGAVRESCPAELASRRFDGPHVDVPAALRDEECDRDRRRIAVLPAS